MKNQICTSTIFTEKISPVADAIIATLADLKKYHPLTVRQVYYQLVSRLVLTNNDANYRKTSRILTTLRENGLVQWSEIVDRSRYTTEKRGYSNVESYLEDQIYYFANPRNYARCLVQQQTLYVEVATEKDALSTIIEEVTWPFCTRLNVIRGQASATITQQMAERFADAQARGLNPVLLHLGDLDPSGLAIPKSLVRNIKEVHGVKVELVRVGLNPEQVIENNLPNDPDAAKKTDPNYKVWLEEFGPDQPAVELDALHPGTLQAVLKDALTRTYDMDDMQEEVEREAEDRAFLKEVRHEVQNFIAGRYPELMMWG